jgi:hypothetical protein
MESQQAAPVSMFLGADIDAVRSEQHGADLRLRRLGVAPEAFEVRDGLGRHERSFPVAHASVPNSGSTGGSTIGLCMCAPIASSTI